MPTIEEMSLEEIDRAMATLRERRRNLKKGNKLVERKIGTLERRRDRMVEQVRNLSEQIESLRLQVTEETPAPKRRGRRPKSVTIA